MTRRNDMSQLKQIHNAIQYNNGFVERYLRSVQEC